tara:strand:- start:2039 stop:2626 length:588 start_codon:yes stop_codon:yes gene_type:complete
MIDEYDLLRYTTNNNRQKRIKSLDELYEVITSLCLADNFVSNTPHEKQLMLEVNIVDCLDVIQFHRKGSADYYPPWSEEKDKKTVYPFLSETPLPTQTLAAELSGRILLFHDKPVEGSTTEGSILLVDKSGQIKCIWSVLNPQRNFWILRLDDLSRWVFFEPNDEYLVLYREKGPSFELLNWVSSSWKTLLEELS